MRHVLTAALAALVALAVMGQPVFAQNDRAPAAPPGPTPHWPDGRVNFGAPAGQTGLWNGQGPQLATPDKPTDFGLFAVGNAPITDPFLLAKPKLSEIPFQPWARAVFDDRVLNRMEPYTRCKPSAGARLVATAYGTQFLDFPELKRFFFMQTGGAHSYRTIYMDGRSHPANLNPGYYGHSIGHWEGETLVVDSVGYNERMWIENLGMPHTDKLHLIEKLTRINFDTIKYEVTIDDPGAYTATWKSGFYMRWSPGVESFEFVCQENNQAFELLVGSHESIDRSSAFVP